MAQVGEAWQKAYEQLVETTKIQQKPPSLSYLREQWEREWKPRLKKRWLVLLLLFLFQMLYFPINKRSKGDRSLFSKHIDGRTPRWSVFVVPYVAGFGYIANMNTIAAATLSPKYWREHCMALTSVTLAGFAVWILYPARVVKRPFKPRRFNPFDWGLKILQDLDKGYGQYNSFPSSHVYYVTLGLYFLSKEFPQYRWMLYPSTLFNASSTLLTHQHYFADAASGFVFSHTAIWLAEHKLVPHLMKLEGITDKDEDA